MSEIIRVKISQDGNPIAYCPWCLYEHEWTVRSGSNEWRCAEAEHIRSYMEDHLAELMAHPFDEGLFTGGAV